MLFLEDAEIFAQSSLPVVVNNKLSAAAKVDWSMYLELGKKRRPLVHCGQWKRLPLER